MKKGLKEILVIDLEDFFKWSNFSKNLIIINAYAYNPISSYSLYSTFMMVPFVVVLGLFGRKIEFFHLTSIENAEIYIFFILLGLYNYILFKSAKIGSLKYAGILKQKSLLLHKVYTLYLLIYYSIALLIVGLLTFI